jgi:hypothetical protein
MFSIPGSSSAWRATFQALQQSFRQAAEAHSTLRHVILQALDEEGSLPPSLENAMREAGGWSEGEIRGRWEVPSGQWKDNDAQASCLDWWQRNRPAKVGYLFGDPAGRKRFEHMAERAWLALPGTQDGKAQAYPQPRALERWMVFVYRQLARAASPYLAAEDELWVVDHNEDGQVAEQRFTPRAVQQGDIVSTGYPDAGSLSNRARRWIYTALATDPFTASAVAIDMLLAHPDPEGPRLVSWQEMDAYIKGPFQDANFAVEYIVLANGRHFPVYRRDCKPVPGAKPSICPSAEPKPPVRLRPKGEMMAGLEKRFRELHLVGDGETIHWVGRQATVETTCVCELSNPQRWDENKPNEAEKKLSIDSGYGKMDARVQALLDELEKSTPAASSELTQLLPVLAALTSFVGVYSQQGAFKEMDKVQENEFQRHVVNFMRMKLGEEVQEHGHQAGGFTDVRYRGVIVELKVEKDTGDRTAICNKYTAQVTQYQGSEARQVSVLLVLDLTPKVLPPGDIRNDILLADVPTHGGPDSSKPHPAKAFVFVLNGNIRSPSSYS